MRGRRVCSLARIVGGCGIALAISQPAVASVYGVDTRRHVYDEDDPLWHDLAAGSVIAKLRAGWSVCDGEVVRPTETLAEYAELCDGEAFADDPVLASCSATLVDTDLVVTARHCVLEEDDCATSVFAPGLAFSRPGVLPTPGLDDLYTCRRVVAQVDGLDIAIVQLDRPVAGDYLPATLGPVPTTEGAAVGAIGFPTGTPMKVARECSVRGFNAMLVRHDCDTFHGNSGSGVFDELGALWGVHVGGAGDYDMQGDCFVTKVYTADGMVPGIPSAPQFGSAAIIEPLLPVLCDSGWPTPLCDLEASCGDGVCSGSETHERCTDDCAAPACGDGVCEVLAELDCDEDCSHLTVACGDGGSSSSEGDPSSDGSGDGSLTTDVSTGESTTTGAGSDGDASTSSSSGGDDETGAGGATAPGEGCACTVTPRSRGPWAFAMLLLLLRRRRR